jgi:hypothetical protein
MQAQLRRLASLLLAAALDNRIRWHRAAGPRMNVFAVGERFWKLALEWRVVAIAGVWELRPRIQVHFFFVLV